MGKKKEKTEKPPEHEKTIERVLLSRPFRRIGRAAPKGLIEYFDQKLKYAGIRRPTRVWLGIRLLFAFLIGGLFLFAFLIITNPYPTLENIAFAFGWWLVGFVLSLIVSYLLLYFKIVDRTSALEKALPDFLLLTVSNLRAGMTPFAAFVRSARPDFGALHEEVMLSAAKTSGTVSLVDALKDMEGHFDSKIFSRAIELFAKGTRSGGQLTALLRSSADEAQHIQDLRAELETSTKTYTLFLGFITMLIMPFLLSISTLFVSFFIELQPEYDVAGAGLPGGIPMFSGEISITTNEMVILSIVALLMTCLLVCSLAGIIRRGRALYGAKYFPIFAVASIVFYFVSRTIVESMLVGFAL